MTHQAPALEREARRLPVALPAGVVEDVPVAELEQTRGDLH